MSARDRVRRWTRRREVVRACAQCRFFFCSLRRFRSVPLDSSTVVLQNTPHVTPHSCSLTASLTYLRLLDTPRHLCQHNLFFFPSSSPPRFSHLFGIFPQFRHLLLLTEHEDDLDSLGPLWCTLPIRLHGFLFFFFLLTSVLSPPGWLRHVVRL